MSINLSIWEAISQNSNLTPELDNRIGKAAKVSQDHNEWRSVVLVLSGFGPRQQ